MLMSQKIAFLINPLKKTVAIANYFSWVMQAVKVEKTDWEIQLFTKEWPSELRDFDQVWVMGGDGTFNYFVNKPCEISLSGVISLKKICIFVIQNTNYV
mgnify:CR=1 FL=1